MNHNYFSNIDTEEKAYWLGFLYADGHVSTKGKVIQIHLQAADREHLVKWHKSLNLDRVVKEFSRYRDDRLFKYVYSSIYSVVMHKDLINSGCIQRKSGKLKFPKLKKDLTHHFIRGFFDGDGSFFRVFRNARYQGCVKYIANLEFLWSIKDFIKCNGIPRKNSNTSNVISQLTIEGNNEAKRIIDIMYKNATIWLDRKKKAIDDHFSDSNINRPYGKRLLAFNEEKTLSEWSKDSRCKVTLSTLRARVKSKWNLEKAITKNVN